MTMQRSSSLATRQPDSLADVLERVLDKGVVIAGDVVVNVLDIELLTLKLRLFISSADTAAQMGMDWWTRDPFFAPNAQREADESGAERLRQGRHRELQRENHELRQQVDRLLQSTGQAEPEALGMEGER